MIVTMGYERRQFTGFNHGIAALRVEEHWRDGVAYYLKGYLDSPVSGFLSALTSS